MVKAEFSVKPCVVFMQDLCQIRQKPFENRTYFSKVLIYRKNFVYANKTDKIVPLRKSAEEFSVCFLFNFL